MKKKFFIIFIILSLVVTLVLSKGKFIDKPFRVDNKYVLNVESGDNFYTLLNKLERESIISNSHVIKAYLKIKKFNFNVKPGQYTVEKDTSLISFINMLTKGNKNNLIKVSIPEGYTIEEIGSLLDKNKIIEKKDFIMACKEYRLPGFIKNNPKISYSLEGYLFPNTYTFKKNSSGEEIIKEMLKNFEDTWTGVKNEIKEKKDYNLDEIIKIASLIEKEAKVKADRAKISSVIYNRLDKKMKLQIDATVLYALGHHKDVVTIKDTKIKSPYNTYYINGLPLGPICNPGRESIVAAMNPERTNYLFYLYKKDETKQHYFTEDYEDFKKAMKKYGY
ncbi:endolytic transglycosylase MltG [Haloimpatiens sp. FM7315]|uniref:endolytic transglycosylase MltG n=1 Tax=Haloimpatiens sp. FM7315 TaxID=3298609 RepID=UPI0035A30C53